MNYQVVFLTFMLLYPRLGLAQDYVSTINQLFVEVKKNDMKNAAKSVARLASGREDELIKDLDTEEKAKAFWLNVYNTFAQYLLKKNPELFDDRNEFFSEELITIAGHKLSLDDIEHGIIRRSKNKYSMGYLSKFSVGDFEKKFRLKKTDYRIHFALNCGAKSCPPVALYIPERINDQLDKSTASYLKANTKLNEKENEIYVPKLCSWFKADFGGEDGVIEMLIKYKIIKKNMRPEVEYQDYDWTLSLSNYTDL